MDASLANLIAAATAFVGTHFALSHPLRGSVTRLVGDKGFQGVYSLVALATFGWMVMAFRAVPLAPPLIEALTMSPVSWIAATVLMLIASVLLVGSFMGNPALPAPGAVQLAAKGPHGVFHSTRHPMMWAMALWSISHFLVSPTPRVLVLTLAIGFLALVGSHMQDRKKAVQLGTAWAEWEAKTNFAPRLGRLFWAGPVPWLGGIVVWIGASWAHIPLAAIPAGIWRWF